MASSSKPIYDVALSGLQDQGISSEVIAFLTEHQIDIEGQSPASLLWKSLVTASLLERSAMKLSTSTRDPLETKKYTRVPYCSHSAGSMIITLTRERQWLGLEEALGLLRAYKCFLHPIAIPYVLDKLITIRQCWQLLLETVGPEALWLAEQHSKWSWFEELNHCDTERLPEHLSRPEFLLWYRSYHHEGLPASAYQQLKPSEQKKILAEISSLPIPEDEPFLAFLLESGKKRAQAVAIRALIRLDTTWRAEVKSFANDHLIPHILKRQGQVIWQPFTTPLPSRFEAWSVQSKDLDTAHLTMLACSTPSEMFAHLNMEDVEICRQMMTDPSLQPLVTTVTTSATQHKDHTWQWLLTQFWIKHYPQFNTQELNLEELLQGIDGDIFKKVLAQLLLMNDEYLLEKMVHFMRHTVHYVPRQLSELLIPQIILWAQNGLTRTDARWFKELLQHFGWRLDPRVYVPLSKLWPEANLYYSSHLKDCEKFRNRLQQRYDLFAYIADLK